MVVVVEGVGWPPAWGPTQPAYLDILLQVNYVELKIRNLRTTPSKIFRIIPTNSCCYMWQMIQFMSSSWFFFKCQKIRRNYPDFFGSSPPTILLWVFTSELKKYRTYQNSHITSLKFSGWCATLRQVWQSQLTWLREGGSTWDLDLEISYLPYNVNWLSKGQISRNIIFTLQCELIIQKGPIQLWQFLLELLSDKTCRHIISWTGKEQVIY